MMPEVFNRNIVVTGLLLSTFVLVDGAVSYFQKRRGLLLSCASSESSVALASATDCARNCLSRSEDECLGFTYNTTSDDMYGKGCANDGIDGKFICCSICPRSDNNSIDYEAEHSWFYWRKNEAVLTDIPLNEYVVIPSGVYIGQFVAIYGFPTTNFTRFHIDFMDSSKNNIALRIGQLNDRGTIMRSFTEEHGWHPWEVAEEPYPYQANVEFEYLLLVNTASFSVYLNGQHIADYKHIYTHVENIRYIRVQDDVFIKGIIFS